MTVVVTVTEYLATRLRQLGVDHLFGVPGDFNLGLLEALERVDGPAWVGTANELGAAYAADGYARRRGFGALLTTYGVGELSAINGVAGAFAEHVPVLQITGAPPTAAAAAGAPLHHTLMDGDYDHFTRAYAEVTAATEVLSAGADPAAQIDRVLQAMLDAVRPGYLSIPADLVDAPVAAAPLDRPLTPRRSDPHAVAALRRTLAEVLAGASGIGVDAAARPGRPGEVVLLAGAGVARAGASAQLMAVAERAGLGVATLSDALGLVDERHPLALGLYVGALAGSRARAAVESAVVVVTVGATLSDLLTGGFTARLDDVALVEVGLTSTRIGPTTFAVRLAEALAILGEGARGTVSRTARLDSPHVAVPPLAAEPDAPLTQDELWRAFAAQLPADHTLVADAGTSYHGVIGAPLSAGTELCGQPLWGSIGWALPAGLGTQLAEPGRRTVVLIGDGAAQMTIQELGTMLRQGIAPIVVLVDNAGYTIERAIRGPEAAYNDIARWDWPLLVRALGGDATGAALLRATTAGELDAALRTAHRLDDRLVFLQVHTDPLDLPAPLASLAEQIAHRPVAV